MERNSSLLLVNGAKGIFSKIITKKGCLVCRDTKTSPMEMVCTFCDNEGEMTENGMKLVSAYKKMLFRNGIIDKKEYLLF